MSNKTSALIRLILIVAVLFLGGCRGVPTQDGVTQEPSTGTQVPATTTAPTIPSPTGTPVPPTPTQEPVVALVNGHPITLAAFEEELDRYVSETSSTLSVETRTLVLKDMLSRLLLAQGAERQGYTLSEDALQARLDALITEAGGEEVFNKWLSDNGYSLESFRADLSLSVASIWMRDKILAGVSDSAEQIYALQIRVLSREKAEEILSQLDGGADFELLASVHDPLTAGDLGWFPRGYIFHQNLEEVAFGLEIGEYSGIVETPVGFHIIKVLDRDPSRKLLPDALLIIQAKEVESWVSSEWENSLIEIFIPDIDL